MGEFKVLQRGVWWEWGQQTQDQEERMRTDFEMHKWEQLAEEVMSRMRSGGCNIRVASLRRSRVRWTSVWEECGQRMLQDAVLASSAADIKAARRQASGVR